MKKLTIATALFVALVLPSFAVSASDSAEQDVTLTINKALEADAAAGDAAVNAAAPSGSTNATSSSGSVAAVNLRSNAAWTGAISASATKMAGIGGSGQIPTNQALINDLKYSADDSTYTAITTSPVTAKNGQRNGVATGTTTSSTYNDTQSYSLFYQQPISWGDEAGSYKLAVTHGVSN
jgi:type II secretory pathway pseudopilin PulG